MLLIQVPGAYSSSSEAKFKRIISSWPGVAVANLHVTRGHQTREVDLFVLSPGGAYLVEVKGTGAAGELVCNANWPWKVGANKTPFNNTEGNPGQQALLAAKILSQQLSEAGGPVGFIPAYVALDAPRLRMFSGMEGDRERLWWNGVCHIIVMDQMPDLPISATWTYKPWMTTGTVRYALHALGVPTEHLPSEEMLAREGFAVGAAMRPPETTRLPQPAWNPTTKPPQQSSRRTTPSRTGQPSRSAPRATPPRRTVGAAPPRRNRTERSYTAPRPDPGGDGLLLPHDTEAWIERGMKERSGASLEWEALYDARQAAAARKQAHRRRRRLAAWVAGSALSVALVAALLGQAASPPETTLLPPSGNESVVSPPADGGVTGSQSEQEKSSKRRPPK